MTIEKKSLISTLKATKKANVINSTPSFEAAHKTPLKSAPKVLKAAAKVLKKMA